jgi:hypothetical protein
MDDSVEIKKAGQAALKRRRMMRELNRSEILAPQSLPLEHYHLIYAHPKSEVITANYEQRFDTSTAAFAALKDLGLKAEPNVEWYEDGQIGFETRVHGMLGLHWMIAAVGICKRANCVREKPVIEVITR